MMSMQLLPDGTLIASVACDYAGCAVAAPLQMEDVKRAVGLSGPHLEAKTRVPAGWTVQNPGDPDPTVWCPEHSDFEITITLRTPA